MLKLMKNHHFLVFLAVWVFFPQVFRQVKEWIKLKLHEMVRLLHVVTCPIGFVWFYDRNWHRGVPKVMKNDHFLVFLAVWVLFSKFLNRSTSVLC